MSFGFEKKRLSGATLALRILELSATLLPLYVMAAVGYPRLLTLNGVFPFLCRAGASLIPRALLLGLGWLYRLTAREILVCFALLISVLAIAPAADRALRAKAPAARRARTVFAAFLTLELALHLLPLRLNRAFGAAANGTALAVLALCLALTLLDLKAEKNRQA